MGNPFGIEEDDPIYQAELQRLTGQQSGNKPGFASAFKHALGSQVQGFGQLASDFGWEDNPIESYGKGVMARNPMDINSLSDVWERPGDAFAQGTGMALGYIAPSLVGRGLNLVGKVAAAPRVAAAGAALNTLPIQAGLAGVPSYGGIREQQEQDGNNSLTDKLLAGVGAAAVGGIEVGFGPQRMLGIGRGAVDKIPSKAEIVAGFGSSPLKTAVKQGARVVGEEMGEELVQNPIEQLSAYQDPRTAENINQTLTGAALAGMGTLAMGGMGGAHAGLQHSRLKGRVGRDLLNPEAVPLGDLRESAEWNREMLAKDEGEQPADLWYNNFMRDQFAERNQQVYQAGLDETKARLYGNIDPNIPLLTRGVIQAEGGESQVSLERLDVLQGRRDATAQADDENTLLSDTKHETAPDLSQSYPLDTVVEAARLGDPSREVGDAGTTVQDVPMPTDLGSAIGALHAVSVSRVQGQAIVAGTPIHAAMLQADTILREAGLDPAKVFADVSKQVGAATAPVAKAKAVNQETAAPVTATNAAPKAARAKGKAVIEFEAKLAAAIESGKIAADDDIVAEWGKTKKIVSNVPSFEQALADKLAGPDVEMLTPEQRLQAGYVKKVTYTKGADGKQVENVSWVRPESKTKRVTQAAVAEGEQVSPDNIEDETHAEGVRMFKAGDSLRQISEALGGSHETWRTTLLGYGYAAKARDEAEAAGAETQTSAATEETPEATLATSESPDDHDGDYTNNDERFDEGANHEGRHVSRSMNSGGATAATTDTQAAKQIKAAVSNFEKPFVTSVTKRLERLGVDFKKQNPQQQLYYLQTAKEGGRDFTAEDVEEANKLNEALKSKQQESKLDAQRRQEAEDAQLAAESGAVVEAAKSILEGKPDAVVGLLTALNGTNGLRLTQLLRTEFGLPKAVETPRAVAEFFVEQAKDRDAEHAAEVAKLTAKLPEAKALWDSIGGYGPEFDSLTPEAQRDFAEVALDFADSPQVLKHLKGQFYEQAGPLETEHSEGAAGAAGRSAASGSEGVQGSQAAASGGTNSGPRVEVKKRRVAQQPEAPAQAEGVAPTASFSRKEQPLDLAGMTSAERLDAVKSGEITSAQLRAFELQGYTGETAEQEPSPAADRMFRRKQDIQELTFTDGAGNHYKETVVTFPYASYSAVKEAVLSRAQGALANVFDKVEGFYLYDGSGDFAYRNPDGTYKVVLSRETAESDAEYISQVIDHELAHVADNADHNLGSKQNFSASPVMGVMVARAKTMWEKLPMAENGLWGHLYYPFNARYDESRNPKSLRMEVFAQLISAYQNPKLSAELKAASPALYRFAEDMHNEIANKDFSATGGVNSAKSLGKTQGNAAVYSRSSQDGKEDGPLAKVRQVAETLGGKTGALVAEDTAGVVKKMVTSMAFLHDLVDEVAAKLPSAKEWYKATQNSTAARRSLEQDAEKIAVRAGSLSAEGQKRVSDFIAKSTLEQKWGYNAEFAKKDGAKQVKADPGMAAEFRKLTAEEQAIVKDVFAHGEMMADKKFELLKKLGIDSEFSHMGKLGGPYAPLKRFGDHIGMLKSKALRDAEEAFKKDPSSANQKQITELKKSPDNYVIRFFDTRGQAKQFAKENADKWHFTDSFEKSQRAKQDGPMKEGTLEKVLSALRMNEAVPASARNAVTEMVRDMYFSALDEHNARMSGLKRHNMAGFHEDMIRSFLSHARSEAGFLANMEFGGEINDQFYKMQQDAKDETGHRTAQDAFNALAAHYAENLNYKETPIQDRVMALTSAWQLATSVGYHLTNFSQGVMVTIPKLAADFGNYQGAWSALMDGYKMLWATGWKPMQAFDPATIKNKGLREALEHAANMGVLDVGMDEDLTQFDATSTGIAGVDKASGFARSALHKLRQVSRSVETANRVSSATAAYNMMYAKTGSVEKAQEYAVKILQTTQGEFSRAGAPLMLKKLPKFVTQYRKYQFMMAALYAKAFRDAFYGASPEVKAIGKRMLAYKMFHTSMAAGLLGLPLMNLVGLMFSMTGDDDDPADLERSLRKWIGDEDLSNLLLHGPLNMVGLDMSAKLGDDKIFSISPYSDFKMSSKQDVANTVLGLAGPAASQAGKFAEGVGFFGRGDYYKGVEQFMPKGVADSMRAFRIANEGFTLKNGDLMVKPEDINEYSLILDGLGVNSSEMKRLNWLRGQQYELKQFYKDRSKQIEHEYVAAYKSKDTAEMQELRTDWKHLQEGKDRVRYLFNDAPTELKKQSVSTLIRYPFTTEKRERKLQRSIPDEA